jgi:hypothetical protein
MDHRGPANVSLVSEFSFFSSILGGCIVGVIVFNT